MRIRQKLAAVFGSACAVALLSACDPTANAAVENHCGYPVEVSSVKNGEVGMMSIKTVADGGTWSYGTVGTEIGVAVRIPGDTEWPVQIPWKDLKGSGGLDGIPVLLKGDLCPVP